MCVCVCMLLLARVCDCVGACVARVGAFARVRACVCLCVPVLAPMCA